MVKETIELYQSITLKTVGGCFHYSRLHYGPAYTKMEPLIPNSKLSDLPRYEGESQICQEQKNKKNKPSFSIRKFTLHSPHIKDTC